MKICTAMYWWSRSSAYSSPAGSGSDPKRNFIQGGISDHSWVAGANSYDSAGNNKNNLGDGLVVRSPAERVDINYHGIGFGIGDPYILTTDDKSWGHRASEYDGVYSIILL